MDYNNIESPFILEKIKTTTWAKRDYINHLLSIYRMIRKEHLSAIEGQSFLMLRGMYKKEYPMLLKEYSPEKYEKQLQINLEREEEERMNEEKRKIQKEQELREQKEAYQQWLNLGCKK